MYIVSFNFPVKPNSLVSSIPLWLPTYCIFLFLLRLILLLVCDCWLGTSTYPSTALVLSLSTYTGIFLPACQRSWPPSTVHTWLFYWVRVRQLHVWIVTSSYKYQRVYSCLFIHLIKLPTHLSANSSLACQSPYILSTSLLPATLPSFPTTYCKSFYVPT